MYIIFQNDGWYQLQRIHSGSIQLHFKVITEVGVMSVKGI